MDQTICYNISLDQPASQEITVWDDNTWIMDESNEHGRLWQQMLPPSTKYCHLQNCGVHRGYIMDARYLLSWHYWWWNLFIYSRVYCQLITLAYAILKTTLHFIVTTSGFLSKIDFLDFAFDQYISLIFNNINRLSWEILMEWFDHESCLKCRL